MQPTKQKTKLYVMLLMGGFLLLTTSQTYAQYNNNPFSWGFKAGISATDMYGDDVGGTSAILGFTGGAWVNYRLSDYFSVQPELLFSTKGTDMDNGLIGAQGTTEYRFGYLEIPVLARIHLPTRNKFEPSIYVGPEVGFALYGDANDIDIDDQMSDAEFGLVFGGGFDFNVANSKADLIQNIGLDLRYTLGLTDTFDTSGDPEAMNGVFMAGISLGF